jgi:hypothetical protein
MAMIHDFFMVTLEMISRGRMEATAGVTFPTTGPRTERLVRD